MRKGDDRIRRIVKTMGVLIGVFVVIFLGLILYSFHDQTVLEYEHYTVTTEKMDRSQSFRIIVLADLHNQEFGEDNAELIRKVEAMEPDLILAAGDMIDQDSADTSAALSLCLKLKEIAPLYYGFGNHEGTLVYAKKIPFDQELSGNGIRVLINDGETIEIHGIPVDVGSIATDVEGYPLYAAEFDRQFQEYESDTHVKIMIAHLPYLFYETLADADYDLAVAGHFHGGQVRLPVLGGVYSELNHRIQLFPKYCDGEFQLPGGYPLIVSRGLGNHEFLPRINDRPEISVIDVKGSAD